MIYLIISAVVVGLDQVSKYLISSLIIPGDSIPIIKNIFHITLVHNTGIAFGMFKNQVAIFILVSSIAIILILYNLFQHKRNGGLHKLELNALCLILGGAIGNLIDRVMFGYVIDFLDFRIWPVFNIADSAITIGIIILLVRCIPYFSK
jgi:signal peptidase II